MVVLGIVREDETRTVPSEHVRNRELGGPPYIQAAVTKIKRLSNDGVQNASRFLCLLGTSLDRAAGGLFASRQVDNAGLVSEMGEL